MTKPPATSVPPPPAMVKYKVKPGETMSSIASDWFGTATKWSLIAEANPLVDPMRMRDGIILKLPPKSTGQKRTAGGTTPPRPPTGTYVVKNGDSLSTIAQDTLGSAAKWRLIYDANRLLIGSDPDDLELGMTLVIPK
jgi:nucleoid-associated protein YgaU